MIKTKISKAVAAGLLFPLAAIALHAADVSSASDKPNIIVILADDIGYGDLSCYGAKLVQTPNLDRLAGEGRRFTDAHAPAATCTPSRRALLTGRYSWRQPEGSHIAPGDEAITIKPGTFTLPGMLKQAGYKTGIVGKWHLGLGNEGGPDWNSDIKPSPLDLGFDYSFIMAATGDRVPTVFIENRRVVGLDPADPIKVSYQRKVGDEPTGAEDPELLTLKSTHGHDMTIVNGIGRIGWMSGGKSALWKDEDLADTFTKKAVEFVEREKDKPFFLYVATHNIHVPRVPNPRHHGKSQCGTRGDAIVELDEAVGTMLATLDRLKLTDKTLVIFSSDNGGIMDDGYEDVGNFEHPCNGSLRGYKGSLFEGGHRVPMIARWPGRIPAGTSCDELVTLLDFTASFAALTGQTIPPGASIDSCNVLPALLGQPHAKPGRETFVAHVGGVAGKVPLAIRRGQWKLITEGGARPSFKDANKSNQTPLPAEARKPFLVNLATDLSESTNVAAANPERILELKRLLEEIIAQGRSPATKP
ncbi:MAG: Arylsulfatase [Verrucomicrobiota bacterium]|jgi:arylsulfatase A-like enzyme